MRAYGLTVDNLLEVELVTADGRVLILNEQSAQNSEEERGESRTTKNILLDSL